jgi:hypothetical protein
MALKDKIAEVLGKYGVDAKTLFSEEVKAMAQATLDNGTVVMTDADEWAVGVAIFIEEDGERMALPDGEYTLEDGTQVTVENGTVAAWETAAEKDEKEEMESEALTEEKVASLIDEKLAPFAEIVGQMVEEFSNESAQAKKELAKVQQELSAKSKELEELKKKPAEKSAMKKVQKVVVQKDLKNMTQRERAYHLFNASKR